LKSSNNRPSAPDDLVEIGNVVGAHGTAGMVRVYAYAESPECFALGRKLTLISPDGQRIRCEITWAQAYKKLMRLALDRVDTRDQAEALAGWQVYMAKTDLPPLEADAYYWNDIIGMAVYSVDDEYLGQVEQIIPTGANDVYVIKTPPAHPAGEILIPAIASVVIDIDVDRNCMRVDLPEGLI
jgi:16S rRNA processing protein RimM